MNRTVTRYVAASLCGLAACVPGFAAKAPEAEERRITLTGQAALSLGELFGLSPGAASTVSLRLGRATEWLVYLLKQDTKERLWNDNEGVPARYDVIELSPAPMSSITISPYIGSTWGLACPFRKSVPTHSNRPSCAKIFPTASHGRGWSSG